jgi:hypothetical protein
MKNYKRQVVAQTVIKKLKGCGKLGGKRRIKKKKKERKGEKGIKKGAIVRFLVYLQST